ncbi:hypothetical protein L227DRAFT_116959 [Lentinus tigrinus ALCF2SS1-6]|uniref:Uncharacterized protein n=1 Tax=Lentinus tigrinus ALCF2SS1-6 TaxID=1328759 RepID=A0A5C2S7P3_9APHY|nr:hypothetical protein L227DRAFT_116959 [Lentinus tigrinus ALCF2SS1-6]
MISSTKDTLSLECQRQHGLRTSLSRNSHRLWSCVGHGPSRIPQACRAAVCTLGFASSTRMVPRIGERVRVRSPFSYIAGCCLDCARLQRSFSRTDAHAREHRNPQKCGSQLATCAQPSLHGVFLNGSGMYTVLALNSPGPSGTGEPVRRRGTVARGRRDCGNEPGDIRPNSLKPNKPGVP